jgi:hypothetical protein
MPMKPLVFLIAVFVTAGSATAEIDIDGRSCVAALAHSVDGDLFTVRASDAIETFFETAFAGIEQGKKQLVYWEFIDACIADMELTMGEAMPIAMERFHATNPN